MAAPSVIRFLSRGHPLDRLLVSKYRHRWLVLLDHFGAGNLELRRISMAAITIENHNPGAVERGGFESIQ